jgi:hypothetical protein
MVKLKGNLKVDPLNNGIILEIGIVKVMYVPNSLGHKLCNVSEEIAQDELIGRNKKNITMKSAIRVQEFLNVATTFESPGPW